MVPALAFNSIIIATNACRGKWNRHAVALSNNFLHMCHFFNFKEKMKKMKIDYVHCPMRPIAWKARGLKPFSFKTFLFLEFSSNNFKFSSVSSIMSPIGNQFCHFRLVSFVLSTSTGNQFRFVSFVDYRKPL